jgi:molybdate transport system substrate-binding protein
MSSTLHLISSMATRQLLTALLSQFEQEYGHAVRLESVGGVDAAQRIAAGEHFDAVVLAANAIDKLIASGQLRAGSRLDLVRSGVAIAVRSGAIVPDIRTEEAVRKAVLEAATISYSTGPSGVYLAQLFKRWGIEAEISTRIVQAPPGVPVGSLVASGAVELGFQQLSELLPLQGITIVGSLPDDIQLMTHFSGAIAQTSERVDVVQQLLEFLASPATAEVKIAHGMRPA